MALVPPYVEIDGLIVPLQVYPSRADRSAGIGHAEQSKDSKLAALRYVVGELLSCPPETVLDLLRRRQSLPMPHGVAGAPVTEDFDDYAEQADRWAHLTGTSPDLSDVYYVGANFVRDRSLVIPRLTFIKLMEKLYELDAAVREGRLEPAIDESIRMPLARTTAAVPRGEDDALE